MRSILPVIAVVMFFAFTAAAQDIAKASASLSTQKNGADTDDFSWGPPPPAPNILFYGGDVDPANPNADAFANGNTLLVPNTPTYGAVQVPKTGHFVITGIFFNTLVYGSEGNVFDPPTATYDIRINVPNGTGGTSVARGSGPQAAQLTGRMLFGYPEYTTSVALTEPFTPENGQTYWFNELPQCTDTGNEACQNVQFYVDNTTQRTGSINGAAQPKGQIFWACDFCQIWFNFCDNEGFNAQQCSYLSFGLYGHR